MKNTTKMSRAVGQLEGIFNVLNAELFESALPTPIISIVEQPRAYGSMSVHRVWNRGEEKAYALSFSAENIREGIEEILDTMIHEMIHLYCRVYDIKETSRGGSYHNGKFKEIAESKGLICFKGSNGWNTTGRGNEKLIKMALDHGWDDLQIFRDKPGMSLNELLGMLGQGTEGNGQKQPTEADRGQKRPSSTRKYICPHCGQSIRATKTVNVICGDCMEKMVEA